MHALALPCTKGLSRLRKEKREMKLRRKPFFKLAEALVFFFLKHIEEEEKRAPSRWIQERSGKKRKGELW